ncbi:MAG: F0F1 ATP synthase subunit delta [Pseudomonadota bacterium]
MAELGTLARPYAKAAFEFALSANALSDWSQQLAVTANVVQTDAVKKMLNNPSLTCEQQVTLFSDVCGDDINAQLKNLIAALAENKRLGLLPDIASQFDALKAEQEKTIDVEIRTAFALDDDTQARLVNALEKKLSREVNANTVIDSSIMGGVIIHAGDLVIDGSAKARLAKLAETMSA